MFSAIVTPPRAHTPAILPPSPSKLEMGRACEFPPAFGHCWPGCGSCTSSVTQAVSSSTKAAYSFAEPSVRVSFHWLLGSAEVKHTARLLVCCHSRQVSLRGERAWPGAASAGHLHANHAASRARELPVLKTNHSASVSFQLEQPLV